MGGRCSSPKIWRPRASYPTVVPMRILLSIPLLLLTLTPALALADPPAETLERLGRALKFLDKEGPARSATLVFDTAISKPDGTKSEQQSRTVTVAVSDEGEIEHTTLKVVQDGVDVTDDEEAQASFGKPSEEEAEEIESTKSEEGSFSVSLTLPVGDDRPDYTFGETREDGAVHVADFRPVEGKSRKERTKLSIGRLAWNPETLDPVWLVFVPDRNPRFIQSLDTRMQFSRTGAWIYPERTVIDGVGGVLLYKRRMKLEMTVSDVE